MEKNLVLGCTTFHQFLVQGIEKNSQLKRGEKKKISDYLGIHPTLLSQVFKETRSLTDEQVFLLCEYFAFSDLESDYVFVLHQLSRTHNNKFKEKLLRRKDELKKNSLNLSERVKKEKVLTNEERSVFYSSWIYSAARLFASLEGGRTNDEIAERLQLDRKKTSEVLDFLVRANLCRFEANKFHHQVHRTHLELQSPHYRQHHSNWRIKSIQSLDRPREEDLSFTGPLSISRKDFDLLREEMVRLVERVSSVVKDSKAQDIFCFNLDFFRI